MDSWQQLETKLVEYAKVEASSRPVIAKCLTALEEDDLNEIAYPAGQHNGIYHCRFSPLQNVYINHKHIVSG